MYLQYKQAYIHTYVVHEHGYELYRCVHAHNVVLLLIMKALKCEPSAQFAYNYTINVLSKCSNIISHRSSRSTQRPLIFEGRHIDHPSSKVDTSIIDPRRSTHQSSIFESRHIDLRISKAETSHRHSDNLSPNIVHNGAP